MLLPRCPRCGKKFQDNMRIQAHLNSQSSSCLTYIEELISISDVVQRTGTTMEPHSLFTSTNDETNDFSMDGTMGSMDVGNGSDAMDIDKSEPCPDHVESHPSTPKIYARGHSFMDSFDTDEHAPKQSQNLYYPFASRGEWELALFLLQSDLSIAAIDAFLNLQLIKNLNLTFRTAKDLRSRAEILPSGPQWTGKPITTVYPTKNRIIFFYRDPLECLQSLMSNPLVKDFISFDPVRIFKTAAKLMRMYGEWLSGDTAWIMQTTLPPGATLLGTILSSDKAHISTMTGNRWAHPLLMSLANIVMNFRMKSSNHAFLLLALLPIPKFIHPDKSLHGVLEGQLIHECLDIVLEPLKVAARIGFMMSDPLGNLRHCFTPLAAYIVDTPESALLAGVAGKTSSVTMATYKQFGDNFWHEPRTASTTLAQLQAIEANIHPWDLEAYVKEAKNHRLCGVHRPFWGNWPMSDPSVFLTPEPLHHWHKAFWDHDAKWCINALGGDELDFRFSVLHVHTAFRHFNAGISQLKQVTGREHRDVQRYILPVIAGAVSKGFLIAVRALMDFRYLAQAPEIGDDVCHLIEEALKEFHVYKSAIIEAGARRGEKEVIDNWYIPKLEFLQSVVPSIRASGAAFQWSADITEHAHITEIKDPARATNNQNYESQICRYLDRADKCRRFDLATAVRDAGVNFGGGKVRDPDVEDELDDVDALTTTSSLLAQIELASPHTTPTHTTINYFELAQRLRHGEFPTAPTPFRTVASTANVAFHLSRDAGFARMEIDDVAAKYQLPDLRPALSDYVSRIGDSESFVSSIGGRRTSHEGCQLLFNQLEVWTRVRLQGKRYHHPHDNLPPQTVNASPPSSTLPQGSCSDAVLVNTDCTANWPYSGLRGHVVVQLCLIMRIIPRVPNNPVVADRFLAYVQRFDIISQVNHKASTIEGPHPDPAAGMYVLKRAKRSNNTLLGDIVPLDQVRTLVELTPRFGDQADRHLTKTNSHAYSSEFWLDKYFTKELFYALTLDTSNV